ncbi:TetR/AcrR family transcriptional regulator [Alkalicoccus urumqiensis]|uniref:TetR family transcriptional regulator n=1 Tax=Alkalicoccus urumqiensis TaxID=1548213 RepID=A0A2P6MHJ6_ALKUR|nr:TetR/AcrR family transcriptional regulator [Alkalicoccus urumqiensis]PRO65738.1 TetR family transcriptional regulator [Alkalicoccus urumqiensis]
MPSRKDIPSIVKNQRLVDQRRQQIIRAAVRAFHEKGYHRTTTREVAAAAGFSIGTLYEYIGSKEDILFLVCDAVYDDVTARWKELQQSDGTGLERLRQVMEAYFRSVDDLQDAVLVMYQETKSLSGDALAYVLEKETRMQQVFQQELAEAEKLGVIHLSEEARPLFAHQILVAGQMWTFRRWALSKHYSIDTYIRLQIDQLFYGLRVQDERKETCGS